MKSLTWLVLLFLISSGAGARDAAEPEVTVRVVRDGETITVDAEMLVPVTPQEAWAVLADYEHFTDFVPNMQVSRIVSKAGEALRVEQKGRARYGLLSFAFESLREVELSPHEALKTRMIKGNMKRMETLTRLVAEGGGTRILYHNEVVPDFWLPPLIGPAFIRHEVAEQFGAIIREMLRRSGDTARNADSRANVK